VTLLALAALGGCARQAHRPPCPQGALCLVYGNGAEPLSLDPAHIDGTWEVTIVDQLIVGLTDRDANGKPVPGMATSWDVSPDKLTWTFHLRDAKWSDGAPVTADDFVYGIRRVLDPKTASYSAFTLLPFLKNAAEVNSGKLPLTAAGVEAPDPHTVVIRLSHPWPLLPDYASGRVMWPVPRHVVERWKEDWTKPGHYVGNGPYSLVSWRLGDMVVLRKNPLYYDAPHVCFDQIDFTPSPDSISNERSERSGDLDVATTVQSNRLGFLRQSGMGDYLRVAPEFGVTYLAFNLKDPALKDVRVRQALSMSIDRDFITQKLLRAGQRSAVGFVPPDMEGYGNGPRFYWAGWSLAQRQVEARRLLAAAGFGPGHPLHFVVKHRNSSDPSLFLLAVQSDWAQVGVNAQLQPNDIQVAYQEYEIHDFQVGDAGWVAGDPMNYLDLARSDTGGQNYGEYSNPAYDGELDAALNSADPAARTAHMQRAETILLADMPVAPLYYLASRNLVNPRVLGWQDNPIDTHVARALCHLPGSARPTTGAAAS
jgi:oligopeptide transport system substrate-binding protein